MCTLYNKLLKISLKIDILLIDGEIFGANRTIDAVVGTTHETYKYGDASVAVISSSLSLVE